jgi:NAD(P)-dependent dehydrogenase (short-subunit alcohol dehydrogenase family)
MTADASLAPQLALVTGATRGLGRALTQRLIEVGWTVVGCGSSVERVAQLARVHAAPHRFDVVDVRDANAVFRWAQSVFESHAAPDLLLNNAAVINETAPLWNVPVDDFARVVDVNLKGVFHVIRAFVPAMCARHAGVIVNFSSGWGRSTSPDVAPYCATKWGVEGLTQALAQELPKGLAAVAFNPGVIDTDMLRACWADDAAQFQTADEWSRRALPFLLSLGSSDNGRSLSAPGA